MFKCVENNGNIKNKHYFHIEKGKNFVKINKIILTILFSVYQVKIKQFVHVTLIGMIKNLVDDTIKEKCSHISTETFLMNIVYNTL